MADKVTKRPRRVRRMDRAILFAVAGGVITLAVSIWVAFEARTPTLVNVNPSGFILVEGPEAELIGRLRVVEGSRTLEVRGLPAPDIVERYPEARRAVCLGRDNPAASWEEPSATLRAHLHSEKYETLCRVYTAV